MVACCARRERVGVVFPSRFRFSHRGRRPGLARCIRERNSRSRPRSMFVNICLYRVGRCSAGCSGWRLPQVCRVALHSAQSGWTLAESGLADFPCLLQKLPLGASAATSCGEGTGSVGADWSGLDGWMSRGSHTNDVIAQSQDNMSLRAAATRHPCRPEQSPSDVRVEADARNRDGDPTTHNGSRLRHASKPTLHT